jgi:DNA modification methylase
MTIGPFTVSGYAVGDAFDLLRQLPDDSINCVVTSPPYWQLRRYLPAGHPRAADELGLEATPGEFIRKLTAVFAEVRRVLRPDGTCWINIGDSRASIAGGYDEDGSRGSSSSSSSIGPKTRSAVLKGERRRPPPGLKPKDLVGIPWALAFALRDDGWYLREEIIWHKLNPQPESVKDRPTRAHEQLFLLTKSGSYYYDAKAIAEPLSANTHSRGNGVNPKALGGDHPRNVDSRTKTPGQPEHTGLRKNGLRAKQNADWAAACSGAGPETRNKRTVWPLVAEPISYDHFAAFPTKLVEPCVLAGCPLGGIVLDPFGGTGTVGRVAELHGRRWLLFDLDDRNVPIARERTAQMGILSRLKTEAG